jgi:hypothetical protein
MIVSAFFMMIVSRTRKTLGRFEAELAWGCHFGGWRRYSGV